MAGHAHSDAQDHARARARSDRAPLQGPGASASASDARTGTASAAATAGTEGTGGTEDEWETVDREQVAALLINEQENVQSDTGNADEDHDYQDQDKGKPKHEEMTQSRRSRPQPAPQPLSLKTVVVVSILAIAVALFSSTLPFPSFKSYFSPSSSTTTTTTTTAAADNHMFSTTLTATKGITDVLPPAPTVSTPPVAPAPVFSPGAKVRDATGREGTFKDWNRLADAMERFHSHFRWEYENIYSNADVGFAAKGISLPRFLREAEQLAHHLDMHHRIEEAYIFPLLAKKIPGFAEEAAGRRSADKGEHLQSHRKIHEGLEHYEKYLAESKTNPGAYSGAKLRSLMDGFRDVLFSHLADEVTDLGAESVYRAGFTLDELKRFPM